MITTGAADALVHEGAAYALAALGGWDGEQAHLRRFRDELAAVGQGKVVPDGMGIRMTLPAIEPSRSATTCSTRGPSPDRVCTHVVRVF
jgi:hypothetical protein